MCSPRCFEYWSRLLALADAPSGDAPRMTRRGFLAASAVPFLAAASASAAPSDQTNSLLDTTLSFDLHSHPGLFKSTSNDTLAGHRQSAEAGRVKLIALTATSDAPVIAPDRTGALRVTREAKPGELYASMYRQIDALVRWSAAAGLPTVRSVADAAAPGAPVRGILAVEGCDFLEGRIERVQEAYDRGLRSLQLVHYRVNELGDIQTEQPVHGGLTAFGKEVVRELNRLGVVVDVAHARFEVVKGVVDTTTQPIILSHSNIMETSNWARLISPEHARLVGGTGGVIGAMPIIFGRRSDDIPGYVHFVSRLVDAAGIDHVGIGTDMDGIGPSAIFTSYSRWPNLAAALVDHGFRPDEAAKVLGGNAQRVFQKVAAGAAARSGG
ncbi:MAG TPA: membrane dipeptidase [Methylomirabilota bacterium]